ncbi:cupin domain-containing protein [Mucilaginibacter segetis]|uniref:Cupin domain-containing protein n=1 Tax=Mucilaginibacter segetis TaxID=2793071 RepID=A0A934PTU5_9SPHI|nr:cupin domain-containing protein [Mucilaginibacter segetis]MBK0378950.1 cupin domain-containing protein [Mucilaginibacter segetis]
MQVSSKEALDILNSNSESLFAQVMKHGNMSVEIYRPDGIDKQTPHLQDEIYVIMSGTGDFSNDGKRTIFNPGDLLFVPAGIEHRFENFTDDFATWVIFYGPLGGEGNKGKYKTKTVKLKTKP